MRAACLTLLLTVLARCYIHPKGDAEIWLAASLVAVLATLTDQLLPRKATR